MQPLIAAKGITKTYRIEATETPVLRGIGLTIGARELLCIIGASGAGKSTLLHVLSSLDVPTSGEVLFEGRELYRRSDEELSRLRNEAIGFVFQFHHLLPEFTALENVMFPLLIRGESKGIVREKSEALLGELGLEKRMHHLPAELSGGEQQRVAVARALVHSPKILFADEPTGNLDHENGEKLLDLFLKLHQEREMALVMVTHNLAMAEKFPRRIYLADGRMERVEG